MNTEQEIDYLKWKSLWEGLVSQIKRNIKIDAYLIDSYSVGMSYNGKFYQLRGTNQTFKFKNNKSILVKAINPKTGKFIRVYEYIISDKKTVSSPKGSHLIYNSYTLEDLEFIEKLKDSVELYYKPTSIKFIMDCL